MSKQIARVKTHTHTQQRVPPKQATPSAYTGKYNLVKKQAEHAVPRMLIHSQ